jgi:hypothetical protein
MITVTNNGKQIEEGTFEEGELNGEGTVTRDDGCVSTG